MNRPLASLFAGLALVCAAGSTMAQTVSPPTAPGNAGTVTSVVCPSATITASGTCSPLSTAGTSGDVITGAGTNTIQDSGTLLSSLAPLASPTFSGTTTIGGTLAGSGVSTYLASPPAIGGSAPAAGAFTTLSATSTLTTNVTGGGAAQCLQVNNTGVVSGSGGTCGGAGSGANPTGTIGLSAVNGSAGTFIRSDGAPPLSQAIAPTWSAAHIFNVAGAASAPALTVNGAPFTGGNSTTTVPLEYVDPSAGSCTTWSTSGTALGVCYSGSGNGFEIESGSTSVFKVGATGAVTANAGITSAQGFGAGASNVYGWTGRDAISSPSSTIIFLSNGDSASPSTQTTGINGATGSNVAGANWTLRGSLSTGSGTSGDLILATGGTGAGASSQNTAVTAMTIKGATQLVQLTAITSDATHTDASVCEDTTTHALYSGSGTLGVCLGTSSARFKHDIRPLGEGLPEIMALNPVSYFLNADHGDPRHELYGFTAEQMAPVLPKLVGDDAQGKPSTADYLGLVPVLVNAIKQQQAEIAELKAEVHRLRQH